MPDTQEPVVASPLSRLRFVKNIDDPRGWAYKDWQTGSQQKLNWPRGHEANANKAKKGELILLVQKYPKTSGAKVTHLVEVSSDSSEILNSGEWGLFRQVSVMWVANFENESSIPRYTDVFGWKRYCQGPNVIEIKNLKGGAFCQIGHSLEIFQRHVAEMLGLIEE